jgi:phosphopantetheinyl transferase (holo-ACP synthase)
MLSTGNDIISLAHINIPRTNQVQFYDKVISPSELTLYHTSVDLQVPFEIFVWLAWSVKESAFKYLQRHQPDLLFSPLKINIDCIKFSPKKDIENFGSHRYETISFQKEFASYGIVRCGDSFFHFRSVIHDDLIFTVVDSDGSFGNIWWGIKTIGLADHKSQSAEVRAFLLQRLNVAFPDHKLDISKTSAGCPIILHDGKELTIPVSLTHHRHYVAYSFVLNESH